MGPPVVELDDVLRIADAGDVTDPDGSAGEARVISRVRELTGATELVIALGGDNSLTYPVALGAEATGLITFDAHFDLRDGISNGTPVRRLVEDVPARVVARHRAHRSVQDRSDRHRRLRELRAYAQRAAEWGASG